MKVVLSLLLALLTASSISVAQSTNGSPASPHPVKILSRAEWQAQPAVGEMQKHSHKFITIHHTGTRQKPERTLIDKMQGLQKFSQRADTLADGKKKPAWPDVPYHYYIDNSGQIAEGRDINFVGDTNTEYDPTGHILICLEGSFGSEKPTGEQMTSLLKLVPWLSQKYKITRENIAAHKDYASTGCPGEHLYRRMNEVRKTVK